MTRNKKSLLSAVLLCLPLMAGKAWAADHNDDKNQLQYHILVAELAGQRGDSKTAAREYFEALQYSKDPSLAERATRVAIFAEEDELALDAARVWLERVPQSVEARELALGLSLTQGEEDEAEGYASSYLTLTPKGRSEGFRQLARIIGSDPKTAEAGLPLLEDLAQKNYEIPEAAYAVALVSLRLGNERKALSSLDRALSLKPGWNDALLLKTSALVKQGRLAEAESTMVSVSGSSEDRAALRLTYARMLLEADKEAEAKRQFEIVAKLTPGQPDALHALALLSLQSGNKEAARKYFEDLYERDPDRRDDSAFYLGTLAEDRGEADRAVLWYARVISGDHEFQALQRRVFLLGRMNKTERARQLLSRYRANNPEQATEVALTEGGLLFEQGDYKGALTVYTGALQDDPNEPELLYGRSLVFERQGRYASAEQDLRTLLEIDAEDARALNALGYILSNHSDRLDEAKDYIERAYDQNPDDPAINDSLGWIHFRQGDVEEALPYLRKAFDRLKDPEIAAHLGEALWISGDQQEAQLIWRDALNRNPENVVLQQTVDRLLR